VGSSIHADHNALTFTGQDVLLVGGDGGIWQATSFSSTPTFNDLNTNLANIEFKRGTIDTLNYGVSFGGTQDNSTPKGGNPLAWNVVMRSASGDADGQFIIDPTNSKHCVLQHIRTGLARAHARLGKRLVDCSLERSARGIGVTSLAMDPSPNGGNQVLVVYSAGKTVPVQKVYRRLKRQLLPARGARSPTIPVSRETPSPSPCTRSPWRR